VYQKNSNNPKKVHEEIRRMNLGNACYHSLCAINFPKHWRSRFIKVFSVILYYCEMWSLTLREDHKSQVFEDKVLRRIFEPKRDEVSGQFRKLHNKEYYALWRVVGMVST
jgi:hypothetical protein